MGNNPLVRNYWSSSFCLVPAGILLILMLNTINIVKADSALNFEGPPSSVVLSRFARDVSNKTTTGNEDISGLNLGEDYDEDYPIIFNILLWLGVSLFIATLAIATAIASMDPGRDSLIYRVTSAQRFKKDN